MRKKTKAFIVLPWVLLLVVCGFEGRRMWQDWSLQRRFREGLPGGPDMIGNVRLLGDTGPFRVVAYDAAGVESLEVTAFGEFALLVETDPWEYEGDLTISVVRRSDLETILQCGSREGVFPSYIAVAPQNGPDAHTFMVGDYDMDGVFEQRMKGTAIVVPPADDQDE